MRDLYRVKVVEPEAAMPSGSQRVSLRTDPEPHAELSTANSAFRPMLLQVLARASRYAGAGNMHVIENTMSGLLQKLLSATETATLKRVARTWGELVDAARPADIAPPLLTPFFMAQFFHLFNTVSIVISLALDAAEPLCGH